MAGPEQWKRCLDAGLTVSIHWDGNKSDAWIRAVEVEALLDQQREVPDQDEGELVDGKPNIST